MKSAGYVALWEMETEVNRPVRKTTGWMDSSRVWTEMSDTAKWDPRAA